MTNPSPDTFGHGQHNDNAQTPVEQLGYEQARDELVETVRILELGQMSLDESLRYWERGEALARRCEELLDGASRRVESALQAAQGADNSPAGEQEGQ